jgi:hypothetical protein
LKTDRTLNMPVSVWLLAAIVAYYVLTKLPGFSVATYTFMSIAVILFFWLCYYVLSPRLGSNEYVWRCADCGNYGVVIDHLHRTPSDVTVWANIGRQHSECIFDCEADDQSIDYEQGPLKLTQLPANIQIGVWIQLYKQRAEVKKALNFK